METRPWGTGAGSGGTRLGGGGPRRSRRRLAAPPRVGQAPPDARGQEDDEQDQREPIDGLGDADELDAEVDAQVLAERDGQRGAHRGPEQRVHPAQHHGEDDAQRHADAGQRVGVRVGEVEREEGAAERSERRGERGDAHLEARDVDAHRGRRRLVLADRLHRRAGHAAVHAPPDPEPEEPGGHAHVVEDALVGELERPEPRGGARGLQAHAERAARPVALGDDQEPDHLAHGERDEAEVVADDLEARARIGHDERQRDRRAGRRSPRRARA